MLIPDVIEQVSQKLQSSAYQEFHKLAKHQQGKQLQAEIKWVFLPLSELEP